MQISVELTYSPLQADYEAEIIDFIKRLRTSKFKILENPLSTQVYGDYDEVMAFLTKEIKVAFGAIDIGLMHLKIVKTDRNDYERNY
ncbi:hypothetical protein Q2T40_16985 [Winogradskyella maritima]|uniref:Thiamine-binding protein n=1 Tax=Winogradskyella maritima TaxID=1517766 RepID=A0ABV8AFW5_9FLAO|nr:hypothetical protein [Winogradskyella maritima]